MLCRFVYICKRTLILLLTVLGEGYKFPTTCDSAASDVSSTCNNASTSSFNATNANARDNLSYLILILSSCIVFVSPLGRRLREATTCDLVQVDLLAMSHDLF